MGDGRVCRRGNPQAGTGVVGPVVARAGPVGDRRRPPLCPGETGRSAARGTGKGPPGMIPRPGMKRSPPHPNGEGARSKLDDAPVADRDATIHLRGQIHVVRGDERGEAGGAHQRAQRREDMAGDRDRDCRSARPPAAGVGHWRPRGRARRAAARRQTIRPGDGRAARPDRGSAAIRPRDRGPCRHRARRSFAASSRSPARRIPAAGDATGRRSRSRCGARPCGRHRPERMWVSAKRRPPPHPVFPADPRHGEASTCLCRTVRRARPSRRAIPRGLRLSGCRGVRWRAYRNARPGTGTEPAADGRRHPQP